MGETKQLLPLGGRPVLQHVLDAAGDAKWLSEIVLIIGADADRVREVIEEPEHVTFTIAVNEEWADGISSSLKTGLRAADDRASAVCVLLGDEPSVSTATIDAVVEAFISGDRPFARPVYGRADGQATPGHPVVIAREVWPEIEGLRGDEGLRALIAAHPEWLGSVSLDGEAPADIDDKEDYARARHEYE
jgi:CTP:molybdopterin cytidylyltransferase MocA